MSQILTYASLKSLEDITEVHWLYEGEQEINLDFFLKSSIENCLSLFNIVPTIQVCHQVSNV